MTHYHDLRERTDDSARGSMLALYAPSIREGMLTDALYEGLEGLSLLAQGEKPYGVADLRARGRDGEFRPTERVREWLSYEADCDPGKRARTLTHERFHGVANRYDVDHPEELIFELEEVFFSYTVTHKDDGIRSFARKGYRAFQSRMQEMGYALEQPLEDAA